MNPDDLIRDDDTPPGGSTATNAAPTGWRGQWRQLRAALRVAQVRLRFVIVFAIAFLVVGKWETLRNYWDRLTSFAVGDAPQAVSGNTEYFCPMCPGVISDWPAKCPVCNMALVRRKKGGPVQLPDGVVSRMQYSPYRLQLAGIRTSAARYMPLAREVTAAAFVNASEEASKKRGGPASVGACFSLAHSDAAMLQVGQAIEITCAARPGQGPWKARIRDVQFDAIHGGFSASVRVEIEDSGGELSPGMEVSTQFPIPLADVEPFRSQPVDPPPLLPNEPRSIYICPDHADVASDREGKCPHDGLALVPRALSSNERLRYWCPMHAQVTADEPGHTCDECKGMVLVPRVVTYRPRGEVLAVPEGAVIDTGTSHIAYVDRGDGMFDGVEVVVGPRAGGYCSIASGLQAGQSVASAGAFLLDAETRLNPNTSAAYFGATTSTSPASPAAPPAVQTAKAGPEDTEGAEIERALSELPAADQKLARRQRVCPVTQLPLGSMGRPEKLDVRGQVVFICCAGCKAALLGDPDKYLPSVQAAAGAGEQP
jgi:hypothetical protein